MAGCVFKNIHFPIFLAYKGDHVIQSWSKKYKKTLGEVSGLLKGNRFDWFNFCIFPSCFALHAAWNLGAMPGRVAAILGPWGNKHYAKYHTLGMVERKGRESLRH